MRKAVGYSSIGEFRSEVLRYGSVLTSPIEEIAEEMYQSNYEAAEASPESLWDSFDDD